MIGIYWHWDYWVLIVSYVFLMVNSIKNQVSGNRWSWCGGRPAHVAGAVYCCAGAVKMIIVKWEAIGTYGLKLVGVCLGFREPFVPRKLWSEFQPFSQDRSQLGRCLQSIMCLIVKVRNWDQGTTLQLTIKIGSLFLDGYSMRITFDLKEYFTPDSLIESLK